MRVKHLLSIAAVSLLSIKNVSFAADSLAVRKTIRNVRIGPDELRPGDLVDSALLKRLRIDEHLKTRNKEAVALADYQNLLLLRSLLTATEVAEEPDARIIGTLEQVLDDYRRRGDLKSQAVILNTYGVYYGKRGETAKAIQFFNEALRIKEKLKDKAGIATLTQNLSALYKLAGMPEKAIAQNEYNIQINQALNRTAATALAYLDLAENKLTQSKYSESEYCILKKALPMFRRTGNKEGRMKSFQNLAELYFRQRRLSEAKWFYIQANIMAEKLNDKEARISNLIKLAEVKNASGEHELALGDFKKAEELARQSNYLVQLVRIKGDMGEVYHQMGNYNAAGTALDEYSRLRSNLLKVAEL